MTEEDLASGLALSRRAGWNQRFEDWRLFYLSNPGGCFVCVHDGAVVGTVTTMAYGGDVGWIAMVLVEPAMRRRGIGAALMRRAVDACAQCPTVKLDATPAGREVYVKLGFIEEYGLCRMTVASLPDRGVGAAAVVRPMEEADLDGVAALDRAVFGADRRGVIESLRDMAPSYARVAEDGLGEIVGFALGRHGRVFEQVGPIVAPDLGTAQALARDLLSGLAGKAVVVDAARHTPQWLGWLESLGFGEQRSYVRMFKGPNAHPGDPHRTFAIAGPELG